MVGAMSATSWPAAGSETGEFERVAPDGQAEGLAGDQTGAAQHLGRVGKVGRVAKGVHELLVGDGL